MKRILKVSLLIFALIFTVLPKQYLNTNAADFDQNNTDKDGFLTDVELIHSNGQTNTSNNSWVYWETITLAYTFDFGYPKLFTGDDTYSFKLPDAFRPLSSSVQKFQMGAFDPVTGKTVPFANVSIAYTGPSGGKVTLDFSPGKDFIASRDDIKGTLVFNVKFSDSYTGGKIDFGSSGKIDVNYIPGGDSSTSGNDQLAMKSSSWYDYDQRIISWTAKANVKEDHKDMVLHDDLIDGTHIFTRYTQEIDDSITNPALKWSTYGWNASDHANKDVVLVAIKNGTSYGNYARKIVEVNVNSRNDNGEITSFSVNVGDVDYIANAANDSNVVVDYYTQAIDFNQTSYRNELVFESDMGTMWTGREQDIFFNGSATGTAYRVQVDKVDTTTGEHILYSNAEFMLQRFTDGSWKNVSSAILGDSGTLDLILTRGNYRLIETKAPDGYELDATPFDFVVDASMTPITKDSPHNNQPVNRLSKSIENTQSKVTSITFEKRWLNDTGDYGDENAFVVFDIIQKDTVTGNEKSYTTAKVFKKDSWKGQLDSLPVINSINHPVTYHVREVTTLDDYTTTITDDNGNFVVTNRSDTFETIEISGKKIWIDDNNSGNTRPSSIILTLYANDGVYPASPTWSKLGNTWTYKYSDLPKKLNGVDVVYRVEETPVQDYEGSQDGYDITNTLKPGLTSVSGTKTWIDNSDALNVRPDTITLTLHANGTPITAEPVWTKNGDIWTYTFVNLESHINGVPVNYTVKETPVKDYILTQNGFELINTYVPGYISIEGTKTWVDNNNQNGTRPETLILTLYADGIAVNAEPIWSKNGNVWSYSFVNVEKSKDGVDIIYTVKETPVKGYVLSQDGLHLKNTYQPELPGTGVNVPTTGIALLALGGLTLIASHVKKKRIATN